MIDFGKWRVTEIEHPFNKVVIEPPAAVDKEFDDVWLEITGNLLPEDKKVIGQRICDKLNAIYNDI